MIREKDFVAHCDESLGPTPNAEPLPERESLGTLLFEMTAQGVVCQDTTGIVLANPAAQRMLGLGADQGHPTVDPSWQFIHEDGSDFPGDEQPGMVALRSAREVRDVVVGVVSQEGSRYRWLNVTAKPLFRPGESAPFRSLVLLDDITEHKRIERALRATEEEWRSLFEVLPVGVSILDEHQALKTFNPELGAILGLTRDGMRDGVYRERRYLRSDGTPMPLDEFPSVRAQREQRTIRSVTIGVIKEDGNAVWTEVSAAPINLPNASCVTVTTDITARRHAESLLSESRKSLREAHKLAHIGVWEWDPHNDVVTWTQELYLIAGLDPALPAPTYREHPHLYTAESWALLKSGVERAMQTGEAYQLELELIRPDGEVRYLNAFGGAKFDVKGQAVRLYGTVQDITEKKRAMEALHESEETFRMLFQSVNDALFVSELDEQGSLGKFVLVNDTACRRLGYTREELLARTPAEINSDHSRPIIDVRVRNLLAERGAIVEAEHVTKDGRIIPVEISTSVATLGNKTVFCSVARDITERKALESAVQRERKFIASVLDTVPVGVVTVSAAGLVTSANQRAISILGLRKGELLQMTHDSADWRISALDGSPFPDDRLPLSVVMATGKPVFGVQHAIHWPDGKRVVLSINAAPAFDEQGHVAGMTASIEEITEVERVENELARSHDLLTNLARLVPSVIYQYRLYPDGRSAFPYSSPGMNDIYEVTPEEVQQDATPVFGRLHPEDYDRVGDAIMESARTLQTFYCEYRVILPRQGLRWRLSQAHPERTEDGGTLWHGIISDITERKRAEEEKATLEDQLHQAQKMEAVGRLAGGVAHDFNNMLGAILGHVEMAMEEVDSNQPLRTDLEEIQAAARRSAALTRQLLAFARKQPVAPKVLDLNQTVQGTLKMLIRLIGEDIALTFQPSADLWSVKADSSQIDQILANLCVNARDAIAEVGIITIETKNRKFDEEYCARNTGYVAGDYVQLAVSDDGCGMDKKTLTVLFEPFFTTKEVGKGTGLGLSTVYGIVKQNGGFIAVYSELGRGTTFMIYLPRHVGQAELAEPGAARPAARGNETILVVEDEPSILKMTKRILERQGYSVVTASTPGEAIQLARECPREIQLLVTDVIMPEMNGRALAKQLLQFFPGLKCVFMSGYTANVIAQHGVLDEEINFIQKPFSKEDLAAKVRGVLDGKQDGI